MHLSTTRSDRPRRLRRLLAAIGTTAALALAGSGAFALTGAASAVAAPAAAPSATACTLQPAGNARYVAWVYQIILARCPDPSGLGYWTKQLNSGMSRMTFVLDVDNSYENIFDNNVMALFEGVLHRAPTQAEIAEWVPKLRSERADADLFATLYSSDAFWNSPAVGSNTDGFIAFLYSAVLDRVGDQLTADPQGFKFYQSVLGPHPTEAQRYHVAYDYFEKSTENAHDWVWASYQSGLGRLPDPTGGVYWTDWVLQHNFKTFDMCNALEASHEAYENAQTQQNPPPAPPHSAPAGA